MARKAQRFSLKERISSWKSNRRAREKRLNAIRNWNWVAIFKGVMVICFLAASGAFLRYAEGYVKAAVPLENGKLMLVGVPEWANWDLKNCVAEKAGGTRFDVNDLTASTVAGRLASMSWLADINVRATHDSLLVAARWRKPIIVIDVPEDSRKIYVDQDLVVMKYMPMPHLPIVTAKGVSLNIVPPLGQTFDEGDVRAAVNLAVLLNQTDAAYTPKTPLLEQIESIDVSNYNGRKNARKEHIILHTKDGAQIIWGAEIGEYAKHLEASDEEKIAKLYGHYREFGSLGGEVKYINLRNPQDRIHQPIEKYRGAATR
ncbi:MAG: hypothetical protein ACM3VT_18995 [Solirubrobacterales bacterium]